MIPRQAHRIWVGGDEPEWTRGFAETWEQPGWELIEWTDENVPSLFPLRNQALYDRAEEICPNNVGQLRSDFLRYEILERFGGMYVDTDFECLRPIDPLIEGVECFAVWERQERWVANGLMGATPGHPFIISLIDGLPERLALALPGLRPNRLTGPHYLTSAYRDRGEGVTILPQASFFPYGWRHIRRHQPGGRWPRQAYAVHHWQNQRREQGVPVG